MAIRRVELTKRAQKDLHNLPFHIVEKMQSWVHAVNKFGLEEIRKVPGFHDEPLYGKRGGQRSICLSRGYRAIYIIKKDNSIEFVSIEEVNLHEY